MDTLSELMDELMLRQVGSPVEIHGESGNITGIYREIHGEIYRESRKDVEM